MAKMFKDENVTAEYAWNTTFSSFLKKYRDSGFNEILARKYAEENANQEFNNATQEWNDARRRTSYFY